MSKRALLVGIDDYESNCFAPLHGCVNDARSMAQVLERHEDQSINFHFRVITSGDSDRVTRSVLREKWNQLFHDFQGDILFYFSGHGTPTDVGGYLVTQDGVPGDPGLPMQELVDMANRSAAATVLIILDCCFSGAAGNPASIQGNRSLENLAVIREGVTILTASRSNQVAYEIGNHGVFTQLLLSALNGGAKNVRGYVSAASVYAFAEAALGSWSQRPLYKSHAANLTPVRLCKPIVSDELLREIPIYFPSEAHVFMMDPTYEETNRGAAIHEHVAIFKKFKRLQIGGLLQPRSGDDLYWTAEHSGGVILSHLGQYYWGLAMAGLI